MNRNSVTLVLVVAATLFAPPIRADIAPPNVDACELLPAGSPCTQDGRLRGECVRIGDAGTHACRVLAKPIPSAPAAGPAASASASSSGAGATNFVKPAPPACSANSASFRDSTRVMVPGWILLGTVALLRRRKR